MKILDGGYLNLKVGDAPLQVILQIGKLQMENEVEAPSDGNFIVGIMLFYEKVIYKWVNEMGRGESVIDPVLVTERFIINVFSFATIIIIIAIITFLITIVRLG